eukprot:5451759-Pleurochrysis_carterae.AAC.2
MGLGRYSSRWLIRVLVTHGRSLTPKRERKGTQLVPPSREILRSARRDRYQQHGRQMESSGNQRGLGWI